MSHKDIVGKPRLGLIPYKALAEIAGIREYGIKKYGDDTGWKTVNKEEYLHAALRHINKYFSGKEIDEESGLKHISHAACSLVLALGLETKITKE